MKRINVPCGLSVFRPGPCMWALHYIIMYIKCGYCDRASFVNFAYFKLVFFLWNPLPMSLFGKLCDSVWQFRAKCLELLAMNLCEVYMSHRKCISSC